MSVKEIEAAIAKLPAVELVELMAWLEDHHAKVWDGQIEDDLEAGRLDALLAEVDGEYEADLSRPLGITGPCLASGNTTDVCRKACEGWRTGTSNC